MSGTIARKTGSLHVHVFGLRLVCVINFSRDQSSSLTFLTRDSRFNTRKYRGSRIETQGTVNLLLSGTV